MNRKTEEYTIEQAAHSIMMDCNRHADKCMKCDYFREISGCVLLQYPNMNTPRTKKAISTIKRMCNKRESCDGCYFCSSGKCIIKTTAPCKWRL